MAAMSKKPYPASGWDESLFEAPDEDYVDVTQASTSTSWPCYILRKLIQEGKYDAAAQVRKELEDIGVVVRPHVLYALAASHCLQGQPKDIFSSSAVASFVSWMSLTPCMNPAEELFTLEPRLLSKCRDLAARDAAVYALKAACRGHFAPIAPHIIPYIMLRTPAAVSSAFLAMVVRADTHYFRDRPRHSRPRERYGRWYSLAIRRQCSTGALGAAASLLQQAREAGFNIRAITYKMLLDKLRAARDTKHARLVEVIRSEEQRTDSGSLCESDAWRIRGPLMLERLVRVLDDGHVPATADVLHFMDLCISSGNFQSLEKLRRHFHNSQHAQRAVPQWVYAEMRYYLRSRRPNAALHVYSQYFSTQDLPLRVGRILSHARPVLEGVPLDELPAYLIQREPLKVRRVVPSTKANGAAWKATLLLSPASKIPVLYDQYIRILTAYHGDIVVDRTATPDAQLSLSRTLKPSTPLSRYHFSLFIRRLVGGRRFKKAEQALQDMTYFGLEPQMKDLTIFADRYAQFGRYRSLRNFLDVVIGLRRRISHVFVGGKRVERASHPRPKIVAVTARAVRMLLACRRYRHAHDLVLRLRKFVRRKYGSGWLRHPVLTSLNRRLYSVQRSYSPVLRRFKGRMVNFEVLARSRRHRQRGDGSKLRS